MITSETISPIDVRLFVLSRSLNFPAPFTTASDGADDMMTVVVVQVVYVGVEAVVHVVVQVVL